MAKLQGNKRIEVIKKWLEGTEDPFWEVMPTKNENKFIVRQRKEPLIKNNIEENKIENNVENNVEKYDEPEIEEEDDFEKKPIKKQKNKKIKSSKILDQNNQILEQLKLLGEEISKKKKDKELKKEIKKVIRKELPNQQTFSPVIDQQIISPNITPQPPTSVPKTYVRRHRITII